MQRNLVIAAGLAVAILGTCLYFLGAGSSPDSSGHDDVPAMSTPVEVARADVTVDQPDAVRPTEGAEEDVDTVVPEDGPPLLEGRVVGEGEGIPDAEVFLFSVARIERTLERLEALVNGQNGFPHIPDLFVALRSELDRFRRSATVVTTGADGYFALTEPHDGGFLLLTLAKGWLFRYGDVVKLTRGETAEVTLELERGAAISGRVVGRTVGGLRGVRVIAEYHPPGMPAVGGVIRRALSYVNGEFLKGPFESAVAEDGSFEIPSLPPGIYDVCAYDVQGVEGRLSNVATGTANAVVYLGASATVEGLLVDAAGFPVGSIELTLERLDDIVNLPLPAATFSGVANLVSRYLGDGTRITTSGRDGSFRFTGIGAGRYRLSVEQPGFLRTSQTLEVDWGATRSVGVVTLSSGRGIHGVVRSEDGRPLAGAAIVVMPQKPSFMTMGNLMQDFFTGRVRTETAEDGSFQLNGLGQGPFSVNVSRRAFASETRPGVRADGTPLEFFLKPGRSLEGVVTAAASGAPVAGAKVRIGEARTRTDAEGVFVLDGILKEGTGNPFVGGPFAAARVQRPETEGQEKMVSLVASARGYLPATVELSFERLPAQVRVELEAAPTITGVVLDPDGAPAPGSLVRLVPAIPDEVREFGFDPGLVFFAVAVADLEGEFTLKDFHAGVGGQYRVIADHPLHARGHTQDFSFRDAGAGETSLEVRLIRGGTVRGTVGNGSQLIPGAVVRLSRVQGDADSQGQRVMEMMGMPKRGKVAHTNSDGRFEFGKVVAGEYVLSAEMVGFADSKEERFTLAEGGTAELHFTLDPGETLAGRVVDDRGLAVAAARVRILREISGDNEEILAAQRFLGGAFKAASTSTDGGFTLQGLPAGRYTVIAEKKGFTRAELLGVWPDGTPQTLVLVPAARFRGRVFDPSTGAPVQNFVVSLAPEAGDTPEWERGGREIHDSEGVFEREDLTAGRYEVEIQARGFVSVSTTVELVAGHLTEHSFPLPAAGRIRGRVVSAADSRPIVGVTVSLLLPGPGGADGMDEDGRAFMEEFVSNARFGESTTTDQNGRYLLESVPESPQTLVVRHRDHVPIRKSGVEVPSGTETNLNFELDPGLTASGKVVDAGGAYQEGRFLILRGSGGATQGIRKTAISDAQGRFQFSGLEEGSYQLVAAAAREQAREPLSFEIKRDRSDLELTVAREVE